jgi:AcrR family transcriptional regulator
MPAGRRTSRTEGVRDRILDTAEELLGRHGFAGTSMSKLCAGADVAPASVYWHFQNKEGVLAAALERGIERYLAEAENASATSTEEPAAALRALFHAIAERPHALRLAIIFGMEEQPGSGIGIRQVEKVRRHGRAVIAAAVAQTFAEDADSPVVERWTSFVLAALDGAVIAQHLDGADLEAVLDPLIPAMQAAAAMNGARAAR